MLEDGRPPGGDKSPGNVCMVRCGESGYTLSQRRRSEAGVRCPAIMHTRGSAANRGFPPRGKRVRSARRKGIFMKRWAESEIEFVKNNYSDMDTDDIADKIKRSRKSILAFASRNKLHISEEKKKATIEKFKHPKGKMAGENNPNWKGGISKNHYHYKKLQVQRNKDKVNARHLIHRAIKSGKIKKQPCSACGDKNSFAHHEDYSKPLDVEWLCRKHHREKHFGLH